MTVFMLIPLLPLLSSLALAVGGRRWGEQGHRLAIPAVAASWVLSIGAFLTVLSDGSFSIPLYQLLQSGSLTVDLGLYIDQITVLLSLLVTGVSTIVHVFSSRYMIGDPRYNRFFAVAGLMTGSMLMVIMSRNLLMLYMFWEVMGLCSYLLIAHCAHRLPAAQAATKVFLVNAIADVGLGLGIVITFATFGTLDIPTIVAEAPAMSDHTINLLAWAGLEWSVRTTAVIPFFFLVGAMGKSAQFPFHIWLPFAMEAPTPVSAMNYAAAVVNAGPFLLLRLSPLFTLSPAAMLAAAVVGAATAVFAAIVGLTQSDIKRSLAYSTISHAGFMVMSCGFGAYIAAVFHLIAHGFLRAFLFLSLGSSLETVQARRQLATAQTAGNRGTVSSRAGALLLALLPPVILFAGPYGTMWTGVDSFSARALFWIFGLGTVFFAAISISRGASMFFSPGPASAPNQTRPPSLHADLLSPRHLGVIVVIGGAAAAGLFALWSWMADFLHPVFVGLPNVTAQPDPSQGLAGWLLFPVGAAVAGWLYAVSTPHAAASSPERSSARRRLYVFFFNKGYVDELAGRYIVQPTLRLARWLWTSIDLRGIDGAAMGTASISVNVARWIWHVVDLKGIDRLTMSLGERTTALGRWLWEVMDIRDLPPPVTPLDVGAGAAPASSDEPRTLQHHLLIMIFWLVLALGVLYVLVD